MALNASHSNNFLTLRTEHQSARVSQIKTVGLDQYGAEASDNSLKQLAMKGLISRQLLIFSD